MKIGTITSKAGARDMARRRQPEAKRERRSRALAPSWRLTASRVILRALLSGRKQWR